MWLQTIGPSVVGDLFRREERALAMGVFNLGPLLGEHYLSSSECTGDETDINRIGPTFGPLVGAYLSQSIGWRWDFWLILIVSVPAVVLGIFFNTETNHQVLIKRKTRALRHSTGQTSLRSCYEPKSTSKSSNVEESHGTAIARGLLRPLKLLCTPLVFSVSLYMAFLYGAYYLLLTTISRVFIQTYDFNLGQAGLVNLSLGLGGLLGIVAVVTTSDRDVARRVKENNWVYEPEMRLPLSIVFALISPATFFIFGWAAEYRTHWVIPLLGLLPFTFAMSGIFQTLQVYMVDCYEGYSATAVAASAVFRSILGATLPIAGPKMFHVLGLGWGSSVLGFICLALVPTPLFLWKFGQRLRAESKVSTRM
jgi:MFS family permease